MVSFSVYLALSAGIHWSPVNSPLKGQWRGALMFSLICAWRLSKQSWGCWFETPSCPLWRRVNAKRRHENTDVQRIFLFSVATAFLFPLWKGSWWPEEFEYKYSNICVSAVASRATHAEAKIVCITVNQDWSQFHLFHIAMKMLCKAFF